MANAKVWGVAALTERLVQGYSTAQGHWCTARHPDVSLRGAKRRGNLAVPGRTTGKPSAKSQLPPRDCTPRALPRASRSGRHVGLRPPRNDKFGRIARSAMLPYNLPACKALAERRYRRNRFVRFIAALYGLQVPSRDSHVASLLGMTNRKTSPSYRQPVRAANASPGPAVRSPTARGWEPSCNSLFLIPPAWAGEWSGRSRDPSPPASSPPGCPRCGRARGCGSRCSGTAAHPAR